MAARNEIEEGSLTHAGALAVREDGPDPLFLLVRSSDGTAWVLPKGHIESGEDAPSAARRELLEEGGVVGAEIGTLSTHEYDKGEERVRVRYFLVRAKRFETPEEDRPQRWESEKDALSLLDFDDARAVLREGAARLREGS